MFLLVLWLLATELVAAPVFTVRMTGRAEGIGLTARKLAVEDAQHQALMDVLQAMTNTSDMAPFKGVLRQASRYVQRHDLLRTDVVGPYTEVEIDVHFFERPLRHDVATVMLPRLPRTPTVLLLIAEYIGPDAETLGPTFHIADGLFKERMKDFDFSLMGIQQLLDHYDLSKLLAIINGDITDAAAFARAHQADVILIGSASTLHEPLSTDTNMMRHRASVVLRAFAGPDGKMTDIMTAQAAVQGVDVMDGGEQAVRDACGKLIGDSIVAVVLTMLTLEDESRVIIEVAHPETLEQVQAIVEMMRRIPGVYGVETLFFSESLARLAVEYSGAMAFFADFISGQRIAGQAIEVTRCVKREMSLALR